MIVFYSHIPKITVKRNGIADGFSNSVFVNVKIMYAAFCLLYVNNLKAVPLYYDLCFYRVAFFLPE